MITEKFKEICHRMVRFNFSVAYYDWCCKKLLLIFLLTFIYYENLLWIMKINASKLGLLPYTIDFPVQTLN